MEHRSQIANQSWTENFTALMLFADATCTPLLRTAASLFSLERPLELYPRSENASWSLRTRKATWRSCLCSPPRFALVDWFDQHLQNGYSLRLRQEAADQGRVSVSWLGNRVPCSSRLRLQTVVLNFYTCSNFRLSSKHFVNA